MFRRATGWRTREPSALGRETIEGLILEYPVGSPSLIGTDAFSNMDKLRLLQLNYAQLTGGYEEFPKDLVWLCWRGFPLSSLPTDFPMENVVVLDVRFSKLKQVWENTMSLSSLKILKLSHSLELTCTPDFSKLPNLVTLILKDCEDLVEVHESIAGLNKLCLLNLRGCTNLTMIPTQNFHLGSLKKLVLAGCFELLKQPEVISEVGAVFVNNGGSCCYGGDMMMAFLSCISQSNLMYQFSQFMSRFQQPLNETFDIEVLPGFA
ncbi:hypothetical protein LguiB_006224 [Lonicera macranthoides]